MSERRTNSSIIQWVLPLPNWNPWIASNIDEGPLATATMESISEDLQRAEQYQMENELTFRLQQRQSLPVFNYRQQILEQIRKHNVILIRGATHSGKVFQFTILFVRNFFFFYLKIPQYIIDDAIEHNQGSRCSTTSYQYDFDC